MGGKGSGRPPSVETIVKRSSPEINPVGDGIFIPNYSGVKPEALKNSPTDITGSGSGSGDNLGNHIATQTLSGSNIYLTNSLNASGTLSGSAYNDGVIDHDALTNFVANEHIDWTSTTSNLSTSGSLSGSYVQAVTMSGSNIIVTGDKTLSGSPYVADVVYTEGSIPTASNYPIGTLLAVYTP